MKRREFAKTIPLTVVLPAALSIQAGNARAATTPAASTPTGKAAAGGSGKRALPAYAGKLGISDMTATGPDGKHQP